ncbi:hypothetical protein, partial [Xenorhabdus kozodoii]|uniref:hypothetical protein n=1 Tax=Xenorhabdus kozodoii TaxID=351676 RepID=UPI001145B3B7
MISVYKFDELENKGIFNALDIIDVNPYKNYLNFKREVNNLILLGKVPKKFIDVYQSPLKMLDFLSKPDHAYDHENSSDTRTKTRP